MKKAILFAVLALLAAGQARGQCTGYTITGTSVNILSPTDAGKQGWTTATINETVNLNGAMASHNVTVTPGTDVYASWTSNNGSAGTTYVTSCQTGGGNCDPTHYNVQNAGLSGSGLVWHATQADVGYTKTVWYVVPGANGASSQDRISITIVAGSSPSIISQDGIHINAYYQLVTQFGGGSMMNQCGECQGGEIQKCLLATHTPYFDASLTNPESGETQTISNAIAGNVAKAQESVSGTASAAISFLPGDHPNGSTTNKIYCTMFGWVMAQQWNPGIPETEFAITAVEVIPSTCALVLRFFEEMGDGWGVQCNVAWKKPPATADRCSAASQIPDFNPGAVWDEQSCKVPGNCNTADMPPPNGTSTSFPKYYFAGARGIRFAGPPAPGEPDPIINGGAHNWIFPWYVAQGYIPGGPDANWWSIFLNLAIPKGTGLPIDCKNKDKGTSPIPVPF